MLSCCGDSLLTLSPIYCNVISSVIIRESMTSHGHMTHHEKDDEDLSPIYRDVIARVRIRESMVDCLRDQLIPPASLLVSRRGLSRAWKPGDEPVGPGWSRRQSTMDYLSHP